MKIWEIFEAHIYFYMATNTIDALKFYCFIFGLKYNMNGNIPKYYMSSGKYIIYFLAV